jgi:hypothetical protein
MSPLDFAKRVSGLSKLGQTDQIRAFIWYLHAHGRMERVGVADVKMCFEAADLHTPAGLHQLVAQLVGKDLIKDDKGLRMAQALRESLASQHGLRDETVLVDKLLSDLPAKLTSPEQQEYLREALLCFRNGAFRAAIVMTWNVAYDHLVSVVVGDKAKLAAFNAMLPTMLGGKKKAVATREDFQRWQEGDVIEVCNAGRLVSKEVAKVLNDKLDKRNSAAHPSGSRFNKMQAEEFISDLIENAVLKIA